MSLKTVCKAVYQTVGGAAVLMALGVVPVTAEETKSKPDSDKYLVSIQTDNDFYFVGRDEDYTFGQRGTLSFPFRKEPDWLMKAVDWFPLGRESKHRRYNMSFGQSVFTPKDVLDPNIIEGERPYAAYMFLGAGYADPSDFHTDLFSINLGVTGDLALGEVAQKALHRTKGSKEPQGWNNQIGTEGTLMMQFVRVFAGREGSRIGGRYWDVTPHAGFSIGTPNTHLMSGVTFRIGTGIDREAGGLPILQPQMAPHDVYDGSQGWAFNIVAGLEARTVLYDYALDGALFAGNPHTVNKKTFTGQAHVGFVVYKGPWRLGYNHVIRAKEYEGQRRRHSYGSITLARYF